MLQLSPAKTVRSKLRLRRQRYATDCVPPDMVTTNADHLGRPYFLVSYGLDGLPPQFIDLGSTSAVHRIEQAGLRVKVSLADH